MSVREWDTDLTTNLISTQQGFRVLIEREWLEFGHKFADRCGHSVERDINERSPVFFQWLHAVYQVMMQFPSAFEFNEFFLVSASVKKYGRNELTIRKLHLTHFNPMFNFYNSWKRQETKGFLVFSRV